MKLYWAKLADHVLGLGAGVTARSERDARDIVAAAFPGVSIASLEIVDDLETLDRGHVIPNMGNVFLRGVWFPKGFEHVAADVR